MTSFSELLSIFALAFVLGALLPFAVRPILHRYNMVDVPNERSSHTAPTYRGMGLATAAATFVAFVVATLFGWTYRSAESLQLAVTIAAAILCALALGWLEDIRGVSIVRRAGLQLVSWRTGERKLCVGAGHEHSAADSGRDFYCRIH